MNYKDLNEGNYHSEEESFWTTQYLEPMENDHVTENPEEYVSDRPTTAEIMSENTAESEDISEMRKRT